MVLLFHLGIFSQASRLTPRNFSNSALLSQRSRSSAVTPGGHATPVRSCSYGQVSRPLADLEGASTAFGGGCFSLTSPTRESRLTDFASCCSSAQRAEYSSSPSAAGAKGRDAGVSRGWSGHAQAHEGIAVVPCPSLRPLFHSVSLASSTSVPMRLCRLTTPARASGVLAGGLAHLAATSLGR